MLGLLSNLSAASASMRKYVKDNLKLYLDFKSTRSDTLKFPCEGSTDFELDVSEQSTVILEILKYTGVTIKDPSVIQAAGQELAANEINEKQ